MNVHEPMYTYIKNIRGLNKYIYIRIQRENNINEVFLIHTYLHNTFQTLQ